MYGYQRYPLCTEVKVHRLLKKNFYHINKISNIRTDSGSSSLKLAAMAPIFTMVSAISCLIWMACDRVERRRLRVCESNHHLWLRSHENRNWQHYSQTQQFRSKRSVTLAIVRAGAKYFFIVTNIPRSLDHGFASAAHVAGWRSPEWR